MVPSLDDLIHDLNGAVMFSRLDLANAFHQLEQLCISSRHTELRMQICDEFHH